MGQDLDVVVVGNVGIDTNIYLQGEDINFQVEANFTENLDYVGQAGGYSSRGFAQLRRSTAFLGYVGDDWNGRFIRQEFERDGINTAGVIVDPAGTSRSVNFMYLDGRRKNFYDGKSHMHLQPPLDQCSGLLARARLALFHIPNWARALLPLARAHGLTVACDLQDIVSIDDPYRQDFVQEADILFFSAANYPDPSPLIEAFLRARPHQVVVAGMGAQGCALGTREGIRFFPPANIDVPIVDTNGAGDGLAVGFLTSYVLDGHPAPEAVRRGQIVARYTCGQKASSSGLITPELLERYASA